MFYRGMDPTPKGYAELRYFHEWHEIIADTELREARKIAEASKGA